MANSAFDALVDVLRRELDEQTVYRVLTCVIKNCGGERVYVPMKLDIKEPIMPTDTPKDVQRRLGCSRRTAYNKLAKYRI